MSGTDGYRYPGPNEFEDTPADHLLFSGRDDEVNAITQQIVSSRLLVLYGSSGLGKSSLLKAGVYPKLRDSNFCPIRVRITDKMSALQLLVQSCEEAGRESDLDYTPGIGNTPWEFFKTAMFWRGEKLLCPVLVFDQFEEIFTTVHQEWKKDFANDIGPLATGNLPDSVRRRLEQGEKGLTDLPPQVKLIFSLREEFYGSLEELSTDFPALFQDRFRLLPMSRSHAELAIRQPALRESQNGIRFHTPTFTYADDTIRMMLGFLAGRHGTIEPFQLQLLCQHVERVIVPQKLRTSTSSTIAITADDLGGERIMSDLVRRFYSDSLTELPVRQRGRARELCDTGLLSSDGHRLMLEKNEILHNYKINEDTLKHLVDKRIVREEPRLDSLFYEIGHDTIANSILKTRRWRVPRKYRVTAAVAAALVIVSTPIFVVMGLRVHFANISLKHEIGQEKTATENAKQAQGKAEDARANAEKLASYLIGEDLMDAIKPIGRIEVLNSVQKQIDDYLRLLKSGQIGETSDRAIQIEGLAHINRGDLDYVQGRLTEAGDEYKQAESDFLQLVQRNSNSPEWLHNLADSEAKLAAVATDQLQIQNSLDLYRQALTHIQKALTQDHADMDGRLHDKLLRDKGDTYQSIGEILYEQHHLASALASMQQAVKLAKEQPEPRTAQWSYILEDGLLGEGEVLDAQGQEKDAEEILQAALETARNTARMNPFDPEAQRNLGVAENQLANVNLYRRNPEEVLAQYQSLNDIMQEAVNWEPKNERWQRDFAYSFVLLAEGNNAARHLDNREKLVQQAIPRFERIRQIDRSNASLMNDLADSHRDLGTFVAVDKPQDAVLHFQEALRLLNELMKIDRTNKELIVTSLYVLNDQAETLRRGKKPDEAIAQCKQAMQLIQTLEPIDSSDSGYWELVSTLHQEMGDILHDKKDDRGADLEYQVAMARISDAIQHAPRSPRYLNDRFLLRYDHMANTGMDSDSAAKNYLDALADASKAADLDPSTAYYLFNRAMALRRVGEDYESAKQPDAALANYVNAEASYKKAIELEGNLQEAQRYRDWLCDLLDTKIAPLRAQQHDAQGELQAHEETVEIRKAEVSAETKNLKHLKNLAVEQENAGYYLANHGRPSAAATYYEEAEGSYRTLIGMADEKTVDKYRDDLCQLLLNRIAPFHIQQTDNQAALKAYDEAIQVRKYQVTADPKAATYRASLARAYQQAGDEMQAQGQLKEATSFYNDALESHRETIKLQPSATNWDELGRLFYNGLAPLNEKQHNDAAAINYYGQAAEAEERALALDPENAVYPCNMAYAHQGIGNIFLAQSNQADAEKEYGQSAQLFQKTVALNGDMPTCWYGLGLTTEYLASIYEHDGDLTHAGQEYKTALQAVAEAVKLAPTEKDYNDKHAFLESKVHQLVP
ncbi:hypothetical protein [Alloacidobacterium sp.]|uniref:nSTAND1 domain-containing NTPase n=1 Tax=Alloacidobacterium sp. TaxID=2951999 RepID=UPI002D322D54|nr:hypothetical protein [Alloacidobacterium sp.]HYK34678.1 hypothetical protein [Alloacidobacterium sp.]